MARTIQEIMDVMIAEKQTMATLNGLQPNPDAYQTFLNDLTTASKVAIWRLIFFVVAVAIWTHEKLWDVFNAQVQDAVLKSFAGTLRWWYEQCLVFQYGDGLSWVNSKYQYYPVNTEHQIIKFAATQEVSGQVQLKVAKSNAGDPVKLTADEKAAFEAYVNQIKPAGTNTLVISEDADLLTVTYDVYINPLLLNIDGSLIVDPLVFPVEDAINNYIKNLVFNGTFYLTKLDDAMQSAQGVTDISRTVVQAKYGALAYADVVVKYNAFAGHLKIDPAVPLSSTLNYILV